ncbi:hypothetical protein ABIC17_002801 [Sphingomonas sp. PvP056]|jgi:hypothetical protein
MVDGGDKLMEHAQRLGILRHDASTRASGG